MITLLVGNHRWSPDGQLSQIPGGRRCYVLGLHFNGIGRGSAVIESRWRDEIKVRWHRGHRTCGKTGTDHASGRLNAGNLSGGQGSRHVDATLPANHTAT